MNRKKGILLLLIFCMALLPVLCFGGVLQHACPDCPAPCGHEAQCSADPCAPLLCSRDSFGMQPSMDLLRPDLLASPAQVLLISGTSWELRDLLASLGGDAERIEHRPVSASKKLLPFESSELPLRL